VRSAVYSPFALLPMCMMIVNLHGGSSHSDNISMRVLGHMIGGCIGSVALAKLMSVLLLCANE